MSRSNLVDLTRCIGCRSCQVACKQWNELEAEETSFFAQKGGYQNPPSLSPRTFSLVTYNEVEGDDGNLKWVFAKRQCMHCQEPSCASACLVNALEKQPEGMVVYNENTCIGCRYCMIACPFDIPKFEFDKAIPSIRKCSFCFDRQKEGIQSACAKACPTDALKSGERDELLEIARSRIYGNPEKGYVSHIYGEHEAGGTSWLYISSVPFAAIGFPMNIPTSPFPNFTKAFLMSVPLVIIAWAGLLTGFHWVAKRRDDLTEAEATVTSDTDERSTP